MILSFFSSNPSRRARSLGKIFNIWLSLSVIDYCDDKYSLENRKIFRLYGLFVFLLFSVAVFLQTRSKIISAYCLHHRKLYWILNLLFWINKIGWGENKGRIGQTFYCSNQVFSEVNKENIENLHFFRGMTCKKLHKYSGHEKCCWQKPKLHNHDHKLGWRMLGGKVRLVTKALLPPSSPNFRELMPVRQWNWSLSWSPQGQGWEMK